MIVTIDGPTASGKSTVARLLAEQLAGLYINSGLLFRAVGYAIRCKGLSPEEDFSEQEIENFVNAINYSSTPEGIQIAYQGTIITPHLKTALIDKYASVLGTNKKIREALTTYQQKLARSQDIVVADGRDAGTVVFPDAELKFFLTAETSSILSMN